MEPKSPNTLLPRLGNAIDTALAMWESYMETLNSLPTYSSIMSEDPQDTSTKAKALLHLLDILPSRQSALVVAYGDPNLDFVDLSDTCANLREEMLKPQSDVELKAWFTRVLTGKKALNGIAQLEKEIASAEQKRMQALKRLKAIQLALMTVREDGELGAEEVEKLLDGMEEVGVDLGMSEEFDDFEDGPDDEEDEGDEEGKR